MKDAYDIVFSKKNANLVYKRADFFHIIQKEKENKIHILKQ